MAPQGVPVVATGRWYASAGAWQLPHLVPPPVWLVAEVLGEWGHP